MTTGSIRRTVCFSSYFQSATSNSIASRPVVRLNIMVEGHGRKVLFTFNIQEAENRRGRSQDTPVEDMTTVIHFI